MLFDFKKLDEEFKLSQKAKGVIHIGAHYGEEYDLYKEMGIPDERMIFIEPLSESYSILKDKFFYKNVHLLNVALGCPPAGVIYQEVEMNVETANQGQSSSILKPALHLQQYPHIQFNKKEKVTLRSFDSIPWRQYFGINITDFNFINIDVQGYELEVFKGMIDFLSTGCVDIVISEVNVAEVYEDCAKIENLDAFLEFYALERVATKMDGITWGDALYLKNPKYR